VGKITDPKSQVEQITIALIYKFMDDMDLEAVEMGGVATYFVGEYDKYAWHNIFSPRIGGEEMLALYGEGMVKMNLNPNLPQLFRDIFKNAYLPYRDPETLKLFLKTINEFSYDHSERLGDAFEYLLSVLGSQGDAGQFRTPRHIIDFIIRLINPDKNGSMLDPSSGTCGFLISAFKHVITKYTKNQLGDMLTPADRKQLMENFTGYDISPDMVRLSLVNLFLHGFTNPKVYEYDTLTSEERWNEYFDYIFANPPFMSPKGGIRPHKRFGIESNRAEVLFVDYIMEHLTPKGKAGIVVPEGIIFQSGNAYKALRRTLVEKYLVGVVSLPSGVFNPYSGVKTSILIIDRELSQKTDKIFFAKVENDGYDLGAQRREIDKNDLPIFEVEIRRYLDGVRNDEVIESEKLTFVTKEQILGSNDIGLSYERYSIKDKVNSSAKFPFLKIKDISISIEDGDWIESKDQSEKGIRLIQTGNIGMGQFKDKIDKSKFISEETFINLKCRELNEGEVLVSRLPDPVGRTCIVPKGLGKMITSVDVSIIRFNNEVIIPKYFIFNTLSNKYYENIKKYITGSSRDRISRKNLMEIEIPLPPIEVQEEIVRELEQYQKIIDGAKQVVDNYKPIIDIDPSWELKELGEVCEFKRGPFGGSLKKEIFVKEGCLVYEQYHAINDDTEYGRYYISNEKYKEMESFSVKEDDLLISCSGTMGKITKIKKNYIKGIINQALLRLRLSNNENNISFVKIYLESQLIQEKYFRNQNGAAIQNVMSVKDLKQIPFPNIDIKTQQSIVERIEGERHIIEGNKKLIEIYTQKIQDRINKIWGN